jgi:tetratricopeptide (TPR) repeat protein
MKQILTMFACLSMFASTAQDSTGSNDSIPFEFNRQAYIYQMAKDYNDPALARMALYNLISYNPRNTSLMDTLALMYYEYNQIASAALISQDVVSMNPQDVFAIELAAICFEQLGAIEKAIVFYEKLYTSTFDMSMLYKVGFLQMDAKRFIEAKANADILIEDPKSKTIQLLFPKEDKQNQEVSLVAGAYRLKGMIAVAEGKNAEAKGFFNEALALAPDFEILKKQIADLSK